MKVTIEGSLTPSVHLATGERATVEKTPFISTMLRRGYVILIENHPEPQPVPAPVDEPELILEEPQDEREDYEIEADVQAQLARDEMGVPARNASRLAWADFFDLRGIEYSEADSRDELIQRWNDYDGG